MSIGWSSEPCHECVALRPSPCCHRGCNGNGRRIRFALRPLGHSEVGSVTAIGRRKIGVSHPKLKEVLHRDFADYSALADALTGQDAVVFCLGTYTGAVSGTELRKVSVDYSVEFARVLHVASSAAAFCFLSGSGADPTGRSRIAFARYKGEAENTLLAAGFSHVYIFRPAYIYPVSRVRSRITGTACCAQSTRRSKYYSPVR
jgi:hypothetical protein